MKCPDCSETLPFVMLEGRAVHALLAPLLFKVETKLDGTFGAIDLESIDPQEAQFFESLGADLWREAIKASLEDREMGVSCPFCGSEFDLLDDEEEEIESDAEWDEFAAEFSKEFPADHPPADEEDEEDMQEKMLYAGKRRLTNALPCVPEGLEDDAMLDLWAAFYPDSEIAQLRNAGTC